MECENCDFIERLKQLQSTKPEEMLYGKKRLSSHENYKLYNGIDFNIDNIMRVYAMFTYNVVVLLQSGVFKYEWVDPKELLYATKGKIWDWTSEEEKQSTIHSIKDIGLYFPIFTLSKGILHNQIDQLEPGTYENKYNSYNGNHRIDAIQSIPDYGKVLILIIPEFCEKSCTGFKYTPIDYSNYLAIPDIVSNHPIEGDPVELFHLNKLENEMKMSNLVTKTKNIWPGIDVIQCIDYQCAFRILQEFQNALEVPLTEYCRTGRLDRPFINTSVFNYEDTFNAILNEDIGQCPYTSGALTCFLLGQCPRTCDKMICCNYCITNTQCTTICKYSRP